MTTPRNTKTPEDMKTGTIHRTNSCGRLKILSYNKKMDVHIRFLDTGFEDRVMAGNIRNGGVKDKLMPTVGGVGFVGIGDYVTKIKGKRTIQYSVWLSMIQRCYCEYKWASHPAYKDCSVCDEWHNFNTFAKWFDDNYIDGYQLDKDIKIEGNRVYCPEACMFVSGAENTVKAKAKSFVFISPSGNRTEIYNLTKFCRDNDLQQPNMAKVYKGERVSHKGWKKA